GRLLPPEVGEHEVVLAYEGLDGGIRRTRLHSSLRPTSIAADKMCFDVTLSPSAETTIVLTISCELGASPPRPRTSFEEAERNNRKALASLAGNECRILTANEQFNDWIDRSLADLRMLATQTEEGLYPYAGVPWYSTIFGRDGLITGLQTLWINPGIARGVLDVLAARQADTLDAERDAE